MELKLEIKQDELDEYLKGKTHHFYKECVKFAQDIAVHADGEIPEKLIHTRRPNESDDVLKYRKEIYESKTESVFFRLWSSLMKIRRSSDWIIAYPESNEFTLIKESETLKEYLDKKLPLFTSITNWTFTELLRQYLIDANAVVFVKPKETKLDPAIYLKPVPIVFKSEYVIDYVEENYAVLRNPENIIFYHEGKPYSGICFYFVTTTHYYKYDQADNKGNFNLVDEYEHGLNYLPVHKVGGILLKRTENYTLYKSRISGIVPELNEAAREYSDLQASMVTSAYAERWEFSQEECKDCKGTGEIENPLYSTDNRYPEHIICRTCKGKAYIVSGPYAKIMVRPSTNMEGGQMPPMPPAGFIQKDTEIIKLQDASVDKHLFNALAALNFQFLDQNPLNVSGKKTEIDKDELNNTVHGVAEDLVAVIDFVCETVARYRYKLWYSPEQIQEMLPQINVPEKFDLIGNINVIDEMKSIKEADLNPVIKTAAEIDFTKKKFYNDPDVAERLNLVLSLDPLVNITQDVKMSMLSNFGITLEDYVISCNIQEFIRKAIDETKGKFIFMKRIEQKEVLIRYAKEIITINNPVTDVKKQVFNEDDELQEEEQIGN